MKKHLKKLLVLTAVVAVALPAWALQRRFAVITTGAGSPFTGTAPTVDCNMNEPDDPTTRGKLTGLNLAGCQSVYVCVLALGANTLSGAGSVSAYFWDPVLSDQAREPSADETIPLSAAGEKELCFPARPVQGGYGCGFWVPVGVTTSGGTQVAVTATCTY